MSATATATAPTRAPEPTAARAESVHLRLAAFAGLALFAALHWVRLVTEPPGGKAALCVLVATAGGAALAALPRLRLGASGTAILAALVALATLLLALVAAGLPARLLVPSHFGELTDGIDRGLVGISHVSWPYDGPDPWVRLTLMLGLPAALAPAAALVFWPARRAAAARRGIALVLLVAVYTFAATEYPLGSQLGKGFLLLVLVAAWLWLPRLSTRELPTAVAVVVAVGLVAMPLASRLDADQPWWDYTAWDPFGGGKDITFDWTHSYGPLNWPRQGTTLLDVRSKRGYYWKTETLDAFDGFRWLHSDRNDQTTPLAELPGRAVNPGQRWDYYWFNPRWDARIRVTVRSLRSDFLVGAGTTYAVDGAGSVAPSADGTTRRTARPLEEGDTYTLRAYVPEPTPAQMREAPVSYPDSVTEYTQLILPRPGQTAFGEGQRGDASRSAEAPPRPVQVPFRGARGGGKGAARSILASPYGGVYRLARRLTAGAPTEYDAIQRIAGHLRHSYTYDEKVPNHEYPLAAFLFRDRKGYCQHFSGAMALMLRMVGIPARVSAGFAPGSHNPYTGEYRVRDLDAHSWVEAFFPGIGWVTFDPTPAAAPAERPAGVGSPESSNGPAGAVMSRGRPLPLGGANRPSRRAGSAQESSDPWGALGLAALGLAAAGTLAVLLTRRRRRAAPPERVAEALLRELEPALKRLGWRVPGGSTLLALERRLSRVAGPAPARYLARLRAYRYGNGAGDLPDWSERRAFRRALGGRGGLRTRLRALIAIPPGGPRLR